MGDLIVKELIRHDIMIKVGRQAFKRAIDQLLQQCATAEGDDGAEFLSA